jgi:hypothetical protein
MTPEEQLREEAEIAAAETDAHMTETERERFIERFETRHAPCAWDRWKPIRSVA